MQKENERKRRERKKMNRIYRKSYMRKIIFCSHNYNEVHVKGIKEKKKINERKANEFSGICTKEWKETSIKK